MLFLVPEFFGELCIVEEEEEEEGSDHSLYLSAYWCTADYDLPHHRRENERLLSGTVLPRR